MKNKESTCCTKYRIYSCGQQFNSYGVHYACRMAELDGGLEKFYFLFTYSYVSSFFVGWAAEVWSLDGSSGSGFLVLDLSPRTDGE